MSDTVKVNCTSAGLQHDWRRLRCDTVNPILKSLQWPGRTVVVCMRCGYATNRPKRSRWHSVAERRP